ncbi:family 43 glycosylhydrolase [Chitinophaga sp. sic0106]|uniref:family 43 glycosylhydrolase n=1 Tax=Chitinophaga sp. sic0106 TaxID=2854785 RepID=UPI002107464B|nr:family 43 glycosylhydrolase [Chitinophaga sp. sic0106]
MVPRSLKTILCIVTLLTALPGAAQQDRIYSGVPWADDQGKAVSAHGGCIVKDKGRYYFFGEKHLEPYNNFGGFTCYSSADLCNWTFERIVLPVQDSGKLGPNAVGERPKVMQCPATGEYILFMHADSLGYKAPYVGYATSANITGPYTFRGPLLFEGKPIRKWDMGTFKDQDGRGYLLLHGGDIYQLADDYHSIAVHVNKEMVKGFESPTLFRKDSIYYFIGSDLTSWERNDNYYFTATSLAGPWEKGGFIAPAGTLTWNSQSTFVLPIAGSLDTTFMFMGDRWSFPMQTSAATYVWQPLQIKGRQLSMPVYHEAWKINISTGVTSPEKIIGNRITHTDKRIEYKGNWMHNAYSSTSDSSASFSLSFKGTQVAWYGPALPDGGYARISITDSKNIVIYTFLVDNYCKHEQPGLRFISPVLAAGKYRLTVAATGTHATWSDKRKSDYGSTGYKIAVGEMLVSQINK